MDLKPFLHALPAFERFSDRQLDALVANLHVEEFSTGGQLITQGKPGKAMYILLSGAVRSERYEAMESDTEPVEIRDGEVFGLLSLADNIPSPETCTAESFITVAALAPQNYHSLFLLAPNLARQLQYMVAVQLARELQIKNKLLRKGMAQGKRPSLLERLLGVSS
jgi:CRP/FNR family cyclic AMP-dependent transcriptional regulator